MKFTIDSSVFIADFMPSDPNHSAAMQFIHWLEEREARVVLPLTIPLEVINVLTRKASAESDGIVPILNRIFFQNNTIGVRELNMDFVQPFSEKCKALNLKTADAIIALTAFQEDATLVSFDRELIRKAKKLVSAKSPQEVISKT